MVYRTAAGEAAGKKPAVLFQLLGTALQPRVLIAADHHSMPVLPEVEDTGICIHGVEEHLFQSQVVVGIRGIGPQDAQAGDH